LIRIFPQSVTKYYERNGALYEVLTEHANTRKMVKREATGEEGMELHLHRPREGPGGAIFIERRI